MLLFSAENKNPDGRLPEEWKAPYRDGIAEAGALGILSGLITHNGPEVMREALASLPPEAIISPERPNTARTAREQLGARATTGVMKAAAEYPPLPQGLVGIEPPVGTQPELN